MIKKIMLFAAGGTLATGLLMQFVPYGHDHTNPPVKAEPAWNRPETRILARQACFDCHSNETVWPWYSNIAPASWLVYHDVTEGRKHINFSDWKRPEPQHVDEFDKVYGERSMPPLTYLLLHPEARLPEGERQQLFTGLEVLAEN